MPKPDDHPDKWQYPEHTYVKHQILDKYLKAWISKLGSRNETLGYIDGFAGRGIYEDGSPGSPIIAMKAAQEQHEKIGKLEKFLCLFVENNRNNFDSLEKQVKRASRDCCVSECELQNDSFENVVGNFLDKYEEDGLIPIFFFIDPFGWDGVPFILVERILAIPKSEILFTFMIGDMLRFLTSSRHHESLNKLFGDESWRKALDLEGQDKEVFLIDLYGNKIKESTGVEYFLPYRFLDSEQRRTKYYLIFVTHHIDGFMLMKNIMKKAGAGMFGFLGPDEDLFKKQIRLQFVEDQMIANFLCGYFRGRQITFQNLCNELYVILDSPVGQFIDVDFRRVLKMLDVNKDPRIRITRTTSKTKRGLRGEDLIQFM